MKKLILLCSLLFAVIIVNAQANYKAKLTEFVADNNTFEIPGKNAEELYQLTKKWIALQYPNPSKAVIYEEENTLIKIKYFFDILEPERIKVKYHLLLEFKEDKVRVTFTNLANTYRTKYSNFFEKDGQPKTGNSVKQSLTLLEDHVSKFVDNYLDFLEKGGNW